MTYEQALKTEHGVINLAEDQRRAKRTAAAAKSARRPAKLFRPWFYEPDGHSAQREVRALGSAVHS